MVISCGISIHCAPDLKLSNFDDGMMVDNGEILFRIVDKKAIGATQGGLIHVIFCKMGPEAMQSVFTGIHMVVGFWLFHNGFSIGTGDTQQTQGHELEATAWGHRDCQWFLPWPAQAHARNDHSKIIREQGQARAQAELHPWWLWSIHSKESQGGY